MSLFEHGFNEGSDQNHSDSSASGEFGSSSVNAGSTGNGYANTSYGNNGTEGNSYSGDGYQAGSGYQQNGAGQQYGPNAYGQGAYNQNGYGQNQNMYGQQPYGQPDRKKMKKARKVRTRGPKKPHPMAKKFGTAVALALVFGVVAGAAFGGTTYIARRGQGTTNSGTSATLTKSSGKISATSTSSATTVTDVSDIVKNVMPAIVQVTNVSVTEYQSFFGMQTIPKETESAGSGIIISQDDNYVYIATNNHVVSNSESLTVTFNDNSAVEGEVQGTDPSTDLAVIKVKISNISDSTMKAIKVATLGSSDDLTVGESAVVIGNALGYGQSVTTGVISALNREVSLQDDDGNTITNKLIQTDAAVNPGNSGGALLNMKGEVVGIVSAKYSDESVEGMGYAIPISSASSIIQELMEKGSVSDSSASSGSSDSDSVSGYTEKTAKVTLGDDANLQIYCMDISSEMASYYQRPEGVYISRIVTGGAADKAGLEEGDVIQKIDGTSTLTTQELKNVLAEKKAGDTVEVTYQHASSQKSSGNSGNSGSGRSGNSGSGNSSGRSGFGFFGN